MMNPNPTHLTGAMIAMTLATSAFGATGDAPALDQMPCVRLTSELIGMKVVSQDGDNLGKIEDVVVRPAGNRSYAVLSFGGWLGMGDKFFAMPWTVLRSTVSDAKKNDSDDMLVLPLTKERLKTAPGFDQKNWPTMANPDWTKDVDAFYLGDVNPNAAQPTSSVEQSSPFTWRATQLKGTNVETPTGEKLGDIKDIAIDANGRVSYVALSVGGFLGMGERLTAVPWDAMKFSHTGKDADEKRISLASDKKQLENAPEFKADAEHRAEMCDPNWIGRVYDYYTCPAYWVTAQRVDVGRGSRN
ncbi:MAG TPA: PRC-barrel domain-containing protein [Pirellulaceae bacterium]|nr:PRC-barrel domain-containing protein [Pirellulaceae bacterium]